MYSSLPIKKEILDSYLTSGLELGELGLSSGEIRLMNKYVVQMGDIGAETGNGE